MAQKRRSKRKQTKRKPSKRKQLKARNECCPLIRVKCKMVTPPPKRRKETLPSIYGEKTQTFYRKIPQPPKKMCGVSLGGQPHVFKLTSEEAGKKVAQLRRALQAKRCMGTVDNKGA